MAGGGQRDRRGGGGGGGGAGRGRGGNISREVQVSKALSKLLRHGAEKEGLKLGAGGYVNVQEVLVSRTIRPLKVSLSELSSLVASNEKQRFSLIPVSSTSSSPDATGPAGDELSSGTHSEPQTQSPSSSQQSSAAAEAAADDIATQLSTALTLQDSDDPSHYLIRANQGHSITIANNEGLLTPITTNTTTAATTTTDDSSPSANAALPSCVVHGTTRKAWPLILASGGLKPMGRNHVHFATGLPAGFKMLSSSSSSNSSSSITTTPSGDHDHTVATPQPPVVISGMRNSSSILIFLDLPKALDKGLLFWKSTNGVILSDGGSDKLIPLDCFKVVEERGAKGGSGGGGGGVLVTDGVVVKEMSSGKV